MTADISAPAPARRKPLRLLAIIAGVLLCVYIASPYYAFWRFSSAIQAGDRDGVGSRVDFPALRTSMKRELRLRFDPAAARAKPAKKDRLHAFLQGMGPTLIDTLVDAYVTPEGLAALLTNPRVSLATKPENVGASGDREAQHHSVDWSKMRYAFFTGPRDFMVHANDTKLRFRFSEAGWRLREINLPEDIATR